MLDEGATIANASRHRRVGKSAWNDEICHVNDFEVTPVPCPSGLRIAWGSSEDEDFYAILVVRDKESKVYITFFEVAVPQLIDELCMSELFR